MDDNRIEIVARLDTSKSAILKIEADLSNVSDKLNADKTLQIIANVDLSKTTQRIQSQLTTISKNLKLDIGGFTFDKNIDNAVSVIQNSLSNIKTGIKIPVDIDENAIENVSDSLRNLGLESKDIERLTKYFQDLDVAITKIKPKFVELAGSGGEKILDSLSISGVDRKTGGIINIVDQLDNIEGKTAKTTYTITQNLAKVEQENKKIEDSAKAAQLAYNDFLKLKGQADVYSKQYAGDDSLKTQIADIQKLIGEFDNTQPLEKQREGIINIDNALKLLKVDIDNIKKASTPIVTKGASDFYPNIAKGTSTQDTISNAKNTLNELFAKTAGMEEDTANRVKRAVEDTTGALQRFYVQVERGDKSVETLTYALNEQGNAYEYLGKTIREADNSTAFRHEDTSFQWKKQSEDLQAFISNAEKAGAASTVLEKDIANLKTKLAQGGDTSAMNSFLDDFDIAKAKFKSFNAEVRKDNAFANLQNRIKRLTADVNAYGEANERATKSMRQMSNGKTFSVEWSRITTEMAKGADLTDRELKDLSADMAVFRKEAQAAGLAGESAFGKFLNSFKTMSSYITANMVFNFVKRQIRDMVNEVTEIDTAMTELRKVTEATDEDFAKFAKSAGQTGRELGASISDVINATSTFSRAGFNLPDAEELGKVATLYKNVGDGITIDSASESIISVMKAFNIEAENSIGIIDRINEVSNRAAIDSGGLGLALQRVASAMDAANNSLDETIALTTVSNEIVQNPEMVAQGWRTVALRIRGAKSELEDAGLETEGMVESTAKLRDLIKGISGVDIMLDENTFKSTYQIIDELGKVWDNISDINQASLLEAIAGKRQSNIVAAALNNYERLDEILKISESSAGSAMREQEEYAKSIQYSIDTLKAAYQDFADSVINSDFVKELLGTAQTFLEILTKIIDKFGTLPTILTGIAAIGGFKNIGLFGNLETGLTSVTTKFETLKQVLSYDFGGLYKKFNINLSGISDSEVQSLQNYIGALNSGIKPAEAMKDIMAETSEAAQQQATQFTYLYQSYQRGEISANQYKTATQNLALTQKTATVTSKALSIALNTLANIGIMVAINLAIKGISTLVDKLVVTKEELAEIRDEAVLSAEGLKSNIETFVEEADAIDELVQKYKEIHLSVTDISESKEELTQIQTDLIDKFGGEASGIDLVNGKYEDQIDVIERLSQAKYDEWKRENATAISRAQKASEYNVGWYNNDNGALVGDESYSQLFLKGYVENTDELAASLYKIKDVSEDIQNIYKNVSGVDFIDGIFSNDLLLSGTLEDARDQLGQIIDEYSKLDTQSSDTLKALEDHYKALNKEIEDTEFYMSKIRQYESEPADIVGDINTQNLDNLKSLISSMGEARASWFENLKDIESGFGKNLDSMTTALQNLSDGKSLSRSDFWNLMELDTDKIITDIKMVGDGFVLNQEQLIKFKDEYIKQQVESLRLDNQNLATKQEDLKVTLEQAKAELSILGARGMSNVAYREQYQKAYESIKQGEKNLADYGEQIKLNNILIDQWNAKLGDTTDKTKQLQEQQKKLTDEVSKLNNELDDYQKAYEYVIDNIIDGLNDELDVLNEQKQTLQDELDALNEQKDAIEDIIDNYDTVNKLVQDTVEKRKEELEAEKKSIEDSYNERINKLKEENEEREDALEYAQKLANLENARNNKRRVLDETRGWRYESVKEDVVTAENDLASFENEQAVKALEKERDEQIKRIDDIIKSETEYSELWKEISEEVQTEEQELLAEQILGADWREKIANHDIEIISKFRTEYRAHNVELQRITGTEIKLKQAAIEAKDAEIKAKQAQIKEWQNYKKEVQDAVKDIKNAQEDYMKLVGDIQLNENSSLTDRANNFETFKNRVTGYINDIAEKQSALEGVNAELDRLKENGDINISIEGLDDIRTFVEGIGTVSEKMAEYIEKMGEMPTINSPGDAKYWQAAGYKQYSAPQKLTAPTPKIYSAPPPITNSSTSNTNSSLSIGAINVYANNPTELSRGLDKELDKYFRTKLTQSYTQK